MVNRIGLNLYRKSVVRLTDRLDMIIVVTGMLNHKTFIHTYFLRHALTDHLFTLLFFSVLKINKILNHRLARKLFNC